MSAIAAAVSTSHIAPSLFPTPMNTSILTGMGWLRELLTGHPVRFYDAFGLPKHVFHKLVWELELHADLKHSKHICAEEQVAIFLHLCETGCTIHGLRERFQHPQKLTFVEYSTASLIWPLITSEIEISGCSMNSSHLMLQGSLGTSPTRVCIKLCSDITKCISDIRNCTCTCGLGSPCTLVVETLVVGGGVTAGFLVLGAGGVAGCAWMQLVMSTIQLRMQELTIGGGESDQLLMSSSSSPVVS